MCDCTKLFTDFNHVRSALLTLITMKGKSFGTLYYYYFLNFSLTLIYLPISPVLMMPNGTKLLQIWGSGELEVSHNS